MDDISPELLKQIQEDFTELTAGIQEEVKSGRMSYEEAYGAAFEVGSMLSSAFNANINADVLPDGRMYFNIANKVVLPMLKEEHDLVSQAAVVAQQNANRAAGIGIRALPAEFDEDKAKGIIDRVSSEPYDDIKWILDEPVKTFAKNVVDRTLQKNVEFQGQSGLHPKIVRRASAGACEWCQAVAGTYEYPDAPDDVYRRHANCDCVTEYVDGGKYQDVWSKKEFSESQAERVASIQNRIENAKPQDDTTYAGVPKTWTKNLEAASEDEILSGTNPGYRRFLSLDSGPEERDYNENCTNSVVAYEMRCRGYDVTAQPLSACKRLRTKPFSAWVGGDNLKEQSQSFGDVIQYINNQDDGSRIQIAGQYRKNMWNQRDGHTFIAEKKDDKIVFKDPQSGAIIKSIEEINDFDQFQFLRIDNLEVTDRGISACKRE